MLATLLAALALLGVAFSALVTAQGTWDAINQAVWDLDLLGKQLDEDITATITTAQGMVNRAAEALTKEIGGSYGVTVNADGSVVPAETPADASVEGRIGKSIADAVEAHGKAREGFELRLRAIRDTYWNLVGDEDGTDYRGYYGALREFKAKAAQEEIDEEAAKRYLTGYDNPDGTHVRGTHEIEMELLENTYAVYDDKGKLVGGLLYDIEQFNINAARELAYLSEKHAVYDEDGNLVGGELFDLQQAGILADEEVARKTVQVEENRDRMLASTTNQAVLAMNESFDQGKFVMMRTLKESMQASGEVRAKAASANLRKAGSPLLAIKEAEEEARITVARASGNIEFQMQSGALKAKTELQGIRATSRQNVDDMQAQNVLYDLEIERRRLQAIADFEKNYGDAEYSHGQWRAIAAADVLAYPLKQEALRLKQKEEARLVDADDAQDVIDLASAEGRLADDLERASQAASLATAGIVGAGVAVDPTTGLPVSTDTTGYGGEWGSEEDAYEILLRELNDDAIDARDKYRFAVTDIGTEGTRIITEYTRRKTKASKDRTDLLKNQWGETWQSAFGVMPQLLVAAQGFLLTAKVKQAPDWGRGASYRPDFE